MLLFFLSLISCIVLHEAAHLVVAKWCGCGVIRYSIGFGKPVIFSRVIKNTIYQLTSWLFGGFCELSGELESTGKLDDFYKDCRNGVYGYEGDNSDAELGYEGDNSDAELGYEGDNSEAEYD